MVSYLNVLLEYGHDSLVLILVVVDNGLVLIKFFLSEGIRKES